MHSQRLMAIAAVLALSARVFAADEAVEFKKLLPAPLAGWQADDAQTTSLGAAGSSVTAIRRYTDAKGNSLEVQITGDSGLVSKYGTMLNNPVISRSKGKIIPVGSQRAVQEPNGDVHLVIGDKYIVIVSGSGSANEKIAYAQAVDVAKLSKM
jgi:hypothetical protein